MCPLRMYIFVGKAIQKACAVNVFWQGVGSGRMLGRVRGLVF
jgi:hypothetical protein